MRLAIAILLVLGANVRAEPEVRPHAVYVEAFGKGGLWGVGYDWQPTPRFAIGTVASFYQLDGDRFTTVSPYVAIYPVLRDRHRGFVQLGPEMVQRVTPSIGPEWPGMVTTAWSGELSAGYEYRSRLLVRGYVMISAGEHVVPWLGGSIGRTF